MARHLRLGRRWKFRTKIQMNFKMKLMGDIRCSCYMSQETNSNQICTSNSFTHVLGQPVKELYGGVRNGHDLSILCVLVMMVVVQWEGDAFRCFRRGSQWEAGRHEPWNCTPGGPFLRHPRIDNDTSSEVMCDCRDSRLLSQIRWGCRGMSGGAPSTVL